MNPIRIMAMLTAKTQDFDARGGGSKGLSAQALAAGTCAGMPRAWWLAARWKWCMDVDVLEELYGFLYQQAMSDAIRERWHSPSAVVPGFCELALAEMAWPGSFKDPERRRLWLDLPKATWYRRRKLYEPVFRIADGWASNAYGYLIGVQRTK